MCRRVFSATYRLQLNSDLTFDEAHDLVDYLHDLGIDTCYISPFLKARRGSRHGYDVVDHGRLNPELGTPESLERFVDRLRTFGMGLLADIVPNHMCVADRSNWRWSDVLENGPSSSYASFFDIDWQPPREHLAHKVLLPTLGDQFGRVLESGDIQIEYAPGAFVARYYERTFPLAPRSWPLILRPALALAALRLGSASPQILEFESIITALGYLPMRTELSQQRLRERYREKEIIRGRLLTLHAECEAVSDAITQTLVSINGRPGDPGSFDFMEQILDQQAFRLSFWRVAADEINYRRFFDINELAALRTEDPAVFEETHRIIFDLVRKGLIDGLRVDHPDGLFDPARYFEDLQSSCSTAPAAFGDNRFYVVAEKIVTGDEELRDDWAVEGTTGYGFLNLLNGLFVYGENKKQFQNLYQRWTGWNSSIKDLIYESKQIILRVSMSSELNVLARRLDRICQRDRHSRDFTLESLRFALREIIACFPVYRTYTRMDQIEPGREDRRHIERAIKEAKARNAATSESIFDMIGSLLLLRNPEGVTDEDAIERRLFVMRFQQLTGPVMAKGVEDTACYRYFPLASIGEVGGDLRRFGVTPPSFHKANAVRLKRWPRGLLATSTHDTKRSEDVRARINALSEIGLEWYSAVRRWHELNAGKCIDIGGMTVPDRNAEYLLYQTLIGAWPVPDSTEGPDPQFVQRIQQYMEKALREAKLHTSWINPNDAYDRAVAWFIARILDASTENKFLADFCAFARPVLRAGMLNSLGQVIMKIASPGVPDFYQGCESWNFSLVDPDNRRSVDFAELRQKLKTLPQTQDGGGSTAVRDLLETWQDGRIKLHVTSAALRFRRCHQRVFESGEYLPLEVSGPLRKHVVAFARVLGSQAVIVVTARFFLKLCENANFPIPAEKWGDTALMLPPARAEFYTDVLTGRKIRIAQSGDRPYVPVAELFSTGLPVALLWAEENRESVIH